MSRLVAIGTAVPPYEIQQSEARAFAKELFSQSFHDIDRLLPIFDHTGIEKRSFSKPRSWFEQDHSLAEKNQAYIEMACYLGEKAIQRCLQQAGVEVTEIDHLIFVSTTGMATPSIDAHLVHRMGMNRHIKRTPIWGLGCAGGVVGLARAFELAKAFPNHRVLLLTVECCGLTFRRNDLSKSNLVATSLFADGAAAVLVVGSEVDEYHANGGPSMVGAMSTIFPHSLNVMGWEILDDGLKVIFSKDIPKIVRENIQPLVIDFVQKHDLTPNDIDTYITHPGGRKVLEAYQEALGLSKEQLYVSFEVLRQYGNMSAVTILFVLAEEIKLARKRNYGLLSTLGPGFSAEFLLLKWGEEPWFLQKERKGEEIYYV